MHDYLMREVARKQKYARNLYTGLYPPRERTEERREILKEILEQIEICEQLCYPVSETAIAECVSCKNMEQLSVKVKTHKGFTSKKVINPYKGRTRRTIMTSNV